jgi:hypothetical protein
MNLDTIEKHCEQQPQVKQGQCMSKLYKPQLDEQRLANVITVKAQTPCKNLQEISTEKRSCSNRYTCSAQHSELNSLLWQHVLNTYEQQRQSQMILTETQKKQNITTQQVN